MADRSPSAPALNRELSWLAFNNRVLAEAANATRPALERLKFLAITASNLDEFFMVRVGGLRMLLDEGNAQPDAAGMTPREQLDAIAAQTLLMVEAQHTLFLREIEPALAAADIHRLPLRDLPEKMARHVEALFDREIYPVLTPLAIPPDGPFPAPQGLALHVLVRLQHPDAEGRVRFAMIALPRNMPRFHSLPAERGYAYALIEDLVVAFADRLFPGESVAECVPFRITRNADIRMRADLAGDLMEKMRDLLIERNSGACIRLEWAGGASEESRARLIALFQPPPEHVYEWHGPLDLSAWMRLAGMPGFDALKDEPWPPQPVPELPDDTPMFDLIARQDALVYHPYQSFDPVVRLLNEAADDPAVLTIKQTLYRVSDNSPIVRALIRAAERGKHITVLVELKARFDEARNIDWAERLEDAGAQVIYGVRGLKTHAKVCLIVRREAEGIRRYMHFGTGNYNERTARLYGDIGLFTCDDAYGADASAFFNAVTGYAQPMAFRKLEAAPLGLRARLLELIENEAERARQGQPGRIMAKMNSLVDAALIDALYRASQAGVEIMLNVRGICCLRPGVRGLSERITVISVVDRFLEHARIIWFGNGGKPRVFISSADWMPRNLDRRIELLVPVEDPRCITRMEEILAIHFADTAQAWRLRSDGVYERVEPAKGKKPRRSQQELYRRACEQAVAAKEKQGITFVPERPAPTH